MESKVNFTHWLAQCVELQSLSAADLGFLWTQGSQFPQFFSAGLPFKIQTFWIFFNIYYLLREKAWPSLIFFLSGMVD